MALAAIVREWREKPPSYWAPGMKDRRDAYVFTGHMQVGVQLCDVRTVARTESDGRRTLVVTNDRACSCSCGGRAKARFEFPLPSNAVADRSRWRVKVYRNDGHVKVTIPKC